MLRPLRLWTTFRRETHAAAAVEMALVTAFLAYPVLNVADIGMYAYQTMQVANAAQAGARAAWSQCNSSTQWPATYNCSTSSGTHGDLFTSAISGTAGIQSTSLGNKVTLASATEGYYCATTTNTLALTGAPGSNPAVSAGSTPTSAGSCATVWDPATNAAATAANPAAIPGDYVFVSVSMTRTNLFTGVNTVASLLTSPITSTAWQRMD